MPHNLLEACEFVFKEEGVPQSSYWLASQMREMKLWRASEADVRAALIKDIEQRGKASRFVRIAVDEFALRSWIEKQGLTEFSPSSVGSLFPVVAKWVRSGGWIEIGEQESFGFVARALDAGGMVFNTAKCGTLDEAMVALESGIAAYVKKHGIDLG
jgi:hypothetical protein